MLKFYLILFIIPIFLSKILNKKIKIYFIVYIIYFLLIIIFFYLFINYMWEDYQNNIVRFQIYTNIYIIITVVLDYIIINNIINKIKINSKLNTISLKEIIYFFIFSLTCSHAPIILYQSNLLPMQFKNEYKILNVTYCLDIMNCIFENYINLTEFWIVQILAVISIYLLITEMLKLAKNTIKFNYFSNIKFIIFIFFYVMIIFLFNFIFIIYNQNIAYSLIPDYYINFIKNNNYKGIIFIFLIYVIYNLFAVVNEEIIFRYLLIDYLMTKYKIIKSIILSLFCWTFFHVFNLLNNSIIYVYVPYVLITGLFLTILRLKKNSILLNVIFHYGFNLIIFIFSIIFNL